MNSIVLRNARVIDPSQKLNRIVDVRIEGSVIADIGETLPSPPGAIDWDLSGKYVCPGLIDLHGHWYEGSAYGIHPEMCLNHGVTTVVDAGTAGFINFRDFRRTRIDGSRIQVLAFLNIAAIGIPTAFAGELEDLRYARPDDTVAVMKRNADVIVGVKIREGSMTASHGLEALDLALEAARASRLPIMVHISKGANTPKILEKLRPGDVVTHCFQGRGDGLLSEGVLIPEAAVARAEGVLFDVGHGCGSFRWSTARRAFEHFFLPDTISTDLHRYSVERWAIDMPSVMSKFLHLGMPLEDVIQKSTWTPAKAIARDDQLGTLRPSTVADVFAFELQEGQFPLEDTHFQFETVTRRIKPVLVIKSGEIINPGSCSVCLREPYCCDAEVFSFLERSA